MITTYLKSTDKAALALGLLTFERGLPELRYQNVVGIKQGQPAQEAVKAVEGVLVKGELTKGMEAQPAVEAKGDPEAFYVCVLHDEPVEAFEGCEVATPEEAVPVCGVWA